MHSKKSLAVIATLAWLVAGTAQAANEPAAAPPAKERSGQQSKMALCNKQAGEKTLKGDERRKFMSECLSSKKAAAKQDASQ